MAVKAHPARRAVDASPDVIYLRLEHIEGDVRQIKDGMSRLNASLIGTVEEPGFAARVASQGQAIESLQRTQRLAVLTFLAQTGALLIWSLSQLYSRLGG